MSQVAAVIGATGFVGAHVSRCLLSKGYTVRGTARDLSKAAWVTQLADGTPGKVELAEMTLTTEADGAEAAFAKLLTGARGAFFCAGFEKMEPATIDFMVNNALALVRAARAVGCPCVVLSSSGGSTNPPGLAASTPKNEVLHWSDPDKQKEAGRWSPAAKTLMELACLKEVGLSKEFKVVDEQAAAGAPRLCIMNPNLILGPQLHPGDVSGNSLPWVANILLGRAMAEKIPNDSMSVIDVRDLALLNAACLEQESAVGRYFGVDRSWPWEELLAAFNAAYPPYKIPPRFEGESTTPTQWDTTRRDSLGVKLRPLSETIESVVAYLIEKGKIPKP
eukprot:TRINITY_DN6039_c0_g1_i1.p1 TRINITY_DN6039_c0_g1~~TRINITY_DN6039_c0_g1_i1.p1  ORF type:complete len:335 (+),score=85.52 TRINITY_DN6039_c0_g1_i1:82-1086(+)